MAKKSNRPIQKLQYRLNEGQFIEVKKSLPKGYEIIEGTLTEPAGTRWARKKGVSLFKRDKSGKIVGRNPKYKDCLVITDEDYFTSRIAENRVYQPSLAKDFITDATTEKKIAAKEKRERKQLQEQKDRDKRSVEAAIAREEAKKKLKKPSKDKPAAQRGQKSRSTNGTKVQSKTAAQSTGAKVQSQQATSTAAKYQRPKSDIKDGMYIDKRKSDKWDGKYIDKNIPITVTPKVEKKKVRPLLSEKPTAPKSSPSFTVKVGRTTKTFATKAEAQAFANQCRKRNVSITQGTRKPTHRVVSFTAKK